MTNFDQYVHPYGKRWIVAEYRDGKYYAEDNSPMLKVLTGHLTSTGPTLESVAVCAHSHTSKSAALKRAKEVYGFKD